MFALTEAPATYYPTLSSFVFANSATLETCVNIVLNYFILLYNHFLFRVILCVCVLVEFFFISPTQYISLNVYFLFSYRNQKKKKKIEDRSYYFSFFFFLIVEISFLTQLKEPLTCPSNICLNGGTCIVDAKVGITCVCPFQFTGQLCETNSKIFLSLSTSHFAF